jgi:hypothetical protein
VCDSLGADGGVLATRASSVWRQQVVLSPSSVQSSSSILSLPRYLSRVHAL